MAPVGGDFSPKDLAHHEVAANGGYAYCHGKIIYKETYCLQI